MPYMVVALQRSDDGVTRSSDGVVRSDGVAQRCFAAAMLSQKCGLAAIYGAQRSVFYASARTRSL